MTAEIAIMNREAIALASDSAVTREVDRKIFTSANKLFALSKYHPIGIMVYDSAFFMGIPWETIIKVYRSQLGKKSFNTLKEHASDFLEFMNNNSQLLPSSIQDEHVTSCVYEYFNNVKKDISKTIGSQINKTGKITKKETSQIISQEIKKQHDRWQKLPMLTCIPETHIEDVLSRYENIITPAIEEVFEKSISAEDSQYLLQIAASLFSKGFRKKGTSGIVIAGFGSQDSFPALESFGLDGIANNRLKYVEHLSSRIKSNNNAVIVPFAQKEMVATFLEGIDPGLQKYLEDLLQGICDTYPGIIVDNIEKLSDTERNQLKTELKNSSDKLFKDYQTKLKDHKQKKYVSPVINVVAMLPKDELAAMAETLVSLTAFKRTVTPERETVGGPIDVAVISKGDGFIWVKRKHYFKPELNPQFFANYYEEVLDEKE